MLQAAATSCRDTQASSKAGSTARVGSAYIIGGLAHSLSEVMFNASSAAFACKAGNSCVNEDIQQKLLLTRPSADLCQVSKPQKFLEEYQTLLLVRVGGVWARDYCIERVACHMTGEGCDPWSCYCGSKEQWYVGGAKIFVNVG